MEFFLAFLFISLSTAKIAQNHFLLKNFTCEIVKSELESNFAFKTLGFIEVENEFSEKFKSDLLKCLPDDVARRNFILKKETCEGFRFRWPRMNMIVVLGSEGVSWRIFEFEIF